MNNEVRVRDISGLRRAVLAAKPGTVILLEPGVYEGGLYFQNVHGAPSKPIRIAAANPAQLPRIVGGANGIQLSQISYFELDGLVLERATQNGLNLDDGGRYSLPSHHITLRNLRITDLPAGNRDGLKLSGIDDFRVEGCTFERWGGSGIDMVGCHRGTITGCAFRTGGDNAVQCKGGTSEIVVRSCRFENAGSRGINLGGSTGLEFFRPLVTKMPLNQRYEAQNIRVEGCTFLGSDAPLAFVGVDGAVVRCNTLYLPRRWAMRILQETRSSDFVPSRKGIFEDNLIVFRSDGWSEGGVNIGSGTLATTFRFARNFWYCTDRPDRSRSQLPTPEIDGVYGKDPLLRAPSRGDFTVLPGSPAARYGAHALPILYPKESIR
ncbi:right-handed parallel beta-helix repeat-containing protein [Armatimonas sp.]|uniref:right-handed parallel beta-helix repeat-containing protein n=1 Tax=Armatimonas sp. TaxID=1872638 RepID=UPI003751E565